MCPPCRHPRHARHTDTGPKGPGPFGAQGSGDGAVHPRETPRGACRRRYAPADGGPVLFRPDYVDRSARLAVDGLGIPETDPDGRPSAGGCQRVGLGPRGGDEALELGRAHRRGPHLERPAVASRLVLDDDRRAEGLLEGLAQAVLTSMYFCPIAPIIFAPSRQLTMSSRTNANCPILAILLSSSFPSARP